MIVGKGVIACCTAGVALLCRMWTLRGDLRRLEDGQERLVRAVSELQGAVSELQGGNVQRVRVGMATSVTHAAIPELGPHVLGTAHALHVQGRVGLVTAAHLVCARERNCSRQYAQCRLGDSVYDLAVWIGCPNGLRSALGTPLSALDMDGGAGVVVPEFGLQGVMFGDGLGWRVANTAVSHPLTVATQDGEWRAHPGEWALTSSAHEGFSGAAVL